MIAQKIIDAGIRLKIDGDNLSVISNQPLTEEQRQYIRKHKPALLDELQDINKTAARKLHQIAQEQDWPLSDLLDWYKSDLDMKDVARLGMPQVREVVRFYIDNYVLCRAFRT